MRSSDTLTVFGLWHLGCVYSACFAEMGYNVVGTDFDIEVVTGLQKGRPPIYEPGLEDLIRKNLGKNILFEKDIKKALRDADFIFIAFDTKVNDNDIVDLSEIMKAAGEIRKYSRKDTVIIVSSQVPVGTCAEIKGKTGREVVYMPENLRLGRAIEVFNKPERIVLGSDNPAVTEKVLKILKTLRGERELMSVVSAEMVKHCMNAYFALNISYISEMTDLCEVSGANINDVVRALRSDSRVGKNAPINPGFGFSGGTLARDVQSLRSFAKKNMQNSLLMDAVYEVNRNRIPQLLKKIKGEIGNIKGKKIGILGLVYKLGTDTLRRSIALETASELIRLGAEVSAFDPKVNERIKTIPRLKVCKSVEEMADAKDLLILITEWPEFGDIDFGEVAAKMPRPVIIDTKNFLDRIALERAGFLYIGMGI